MRPEQGLLALRKGLGLYANLRPVQPHAATLGASPIKPHLLAGVDLIDDLFPRHVANEHRLLAGFSADEVAAHVAYLLSPRSRAVNGTTLLSDFGYTARSGFPA